MNVSNKLSYNRPWPKLPDRALYGLTGQVVEMILPHTEGDPAALAMDFLIGFGIMAGNEIGQRPHMEADGAQHPARLNALIVGDTSRARKSSAYQRVYQIMSKVNPDFTATRIRSGFGSGEALIDDVAESADKRLWVCESEFSRVLVAANRDGSILSHVMRQAWDGDRLQVRTRKKRVMADEAHVAVLGHITMEDLRANLTQKDAANGFLNRFLIVCVKRSQNLPSGGSLEDGQMNKKARLINERLNKTKNITEMSRSEKAERLWAQYYEEMAHDNPGGVLEGIIARSEAQVLRLSVVYALTDGSAVINTQHVHAAWAMWSYCRASAAYVFGRGILADMILAGLDKTEKESLSKTDIHQLLGRHEKAEDINNILEGLENEGVVEIVTLERGSGRPETRVRLKSRTK